MDLGDRVGIDVAEHARVELDHALHGDSSPMHGIREMAAASLPRNTKFSKGTRPVAAKAAAEAAAAAFNQERLSRYSGATDSTHMAPTT